MKALAFLPGAALAGAAFVLLLPADAPRAADAPRLADRQPPPTAKETRAFLKALLKYVEDNHLKKDARSPQRGMVYEYFDTTRKGKFDQWVQGEALDTMHDGAWLAAALVHAHRATGDGAYKEFLTRWQLPFYCKMLNESDKLFSAKRNDARPKGHTFGKEHALQEGEKGFVPYWWDDGASVSLERRRDRNPRGPFPCTDNLAGKPNPQYLLNGYSHGSSNHLAQDLGVMLQLSWLLLRGSDDKKDLQLAKEVAEAAQNLHASRMRHHGPIPMVVAPAALAGADAKLLKRLPDLTAKGAGEPSNHYWRALYDFKPGQRYAFPGFADDQQYRYHAGLARHGGKPPEALAFKTVYDAFTEPLLFRAYSDDAVVPPGVNRFDLHPYYAKDGRPEDYRSDLKGPGKGPRPAGSRMGPQNMVCCGWALQMLKARPGLWEGRYKRDFAKDLRVSIDDRPPGYEGPPAPPAEWKGTDATLYLRSTRTELHLLGQCKGEKLTVEIFARPDAKGPYARLELAEGKSRVVNDKGEVLKANIRFTPRGGRAGFDVQLPYTLVKGQKGWANGVEHGRYSVRVGKEVRNVYLASPEAQVRAWLEHELGGGLRTWQAVFKDKGFIPTGIGAGGEWDRFSDSGGYAHLIAAGAQWLLVLDGKRDWELHKVPAVR